MYKLSLSIKKIKTLSGEEVKIMIFRHMLVKFFFNHVKFNNIINRKLTYCWKVTLRSGYMYNNPWFKSSLSMQCTFLT